MTTHESPVKYSFGAFLAKLVHTSFDKNIKINLFILNTVRHAFYINAYKAIIISFLSFHIELGNLYKIR